MTYRPNQGKQKLILIVDELKLIWSSFGNSVETNFFNAKNLLSN